MLSQIFTTCKNALASWQLYFCNILHYFTSSLLLMLMKLFCRCWLLSMDRTKVRMFTLAFNGFTNFIQSLNYSLFILLSPCARNASNFCCAILISSFCLAVIYFPSAFRFWMRAFFFCFSLSFFSRSNRSYAKTYLSNKQERLTKAANIALSLIIHTW